MPYRLSFVLAPPERELRRRTLDALFRCLTAIDVLYLQSHPRTPPLARSGVRHLEEPPGQEDWQDIPTTLHYGVGDFEDLACWAAAEKVIRQRLAIARAAPRATSDMTLPDRVTFAMDLFQGGKERDLSMRTLNVLLACLAEIDVLYLQAHPEAPRLYDSRIRYMEEPPGQEDWQDIPTCLKMGIGDCLPLKTAIELTSGKRITIGELVPGDWIVGDDREPTMVLEGAVTGEKPILNIHLDTGRTLRCSPDHRIIARDGREMPASHAYPGLRLRSPRVFPKVVDIQEGPAEVCADIKTDSGRFYLPEADVVVHNCEDLACWLAAERVVKDKAFARPIFRSYPRKDGSTLYHIVTEVRQRDGRVLIEDPSDLQGMR